jgi:hypothetical protein
VGARQSEFGRIARDARDARDVSGERRTIRDQREGEGPTLVMVKDDKVGSRVDVVGDSAHVEAIVEAGEEENESVYVQYRRSRQARQARQLVGKRQRTH